MREVNPQQLEELVDHTIQGVRAGKHQDPDDDKLIASAISGNADVIVSGD